MASQSAERSLTHLLRETPTPDGWAEERELKDDSENDSEDDSEDDAHEGVVDISSKREQSSSNS